MNEIALLIAPVALAIAVTIVLTPCWMAVCKKWHLFDTPDDRKHHIKTTPSMGGLAIFAGLFISFFIFSGDVNFYKLKFVLVGTLLLFFTGFFDDLLNIPPHKKLVAQVLAALIVIAGGTRITNLYGIIGIHEIPSLFQFPITLLVIVFFINAYNFIDGIDGLAATLGIISALIFGYMFFKYGQTDFALLCFCLMGALTGFMFYNFHPAKIFMGDTGSLVIGFLLVAFAINLLDVNAATFSHQPVISPTLIFAVLFIPVYDILRVSVIRILNGDSPLKADRNHIHHMILRQGFGHAGATIILAVFNVFIIALVYMLDTLNANGFILLTICVAMISINSFVMLRIASVRDKVLGNASKKLEVTDL